MSKPHDAGDAGRRQYHFSDDDREWIRRRLKERRMSVPAFADAIGQTRQAVYLILRGVTKATYDWPRIVAALGGTPPSGMPPIEDERLKNIIRRWPEMSEGDKLIVEQLAQRFSAKKS